MVNPFEGMSFARMGTLYHNFGEFVDGLEAHGTSMAGDSKTAGTSKALIDLANYYRQQILPQFRTWISEETTRTSGFPIEFTHEQLMLNFGDEPSSKQQGAASTPDTSQHASAPSDAASSHPVFGDVAVRQAIAYAVDRDALRDTAALLNTWGAGYADHLSTGNPQAWAHFTDEFADQVYAFDAATADELLTQAGWVMGPDGVRVAHDALYAGPTLLSFQLNPTPTELADIASAVASDLPGADPLSRAELYAQIQQEYFADSPFFSIWSAAAMPYYSREMFEQAGVAYPSDPAEWNWETVAELAKLLTIDDQGRNALDPDFDPNQVIQQGYRTTPWWKSAPAKVGGAVAGVVLLAGAGFGAYQAFGSGDGDEGGDEPPIVALTDDFQWSDGTPFTQEDVRFFYDVILANGWEANAGNWNAVQDPLNDPFNTFTLDTTFTDPLVELTGGSAIMITVGSGGPDFACGSSMPVDMTVVCAPGVAGPLPAGDYIFVLGGVQNNLSQRQPGLEYRYNAFFEDSGRPLIFPDGDPRPEYPYNTLARTNSYFELSSTGTDGWALNGTYIDVPNQQSLDFSEAGPAQDIASQVRGAIGGNTFAYVVPVTWFNGPEVRFNVGTNVHTAGVEYAADNVALDVLGATSLDDKVQIPRLDEELVTRIEDTIAAIEGRLPDYEVWVRDGNGAEMRAHLDQSAIDHWGAARCDTYFGNLGGDDTFALEVINARGPVPWTWQIYGETVGTIPDAYEFDVAVTQQGTTQQATVHFAWNEETRDVRVFSPCITPAQATPGAGAPSTTASPSAAPAGSGPFAASVKAAMPLFEEWRRTGNGAEQFASLHPISIAYWGEATCRTFYDTGIGADPTFKFVSIGDVTGPTPYNYMAVGTTIGTADAYSVQAETTIQGGTQTYTWRFGWDEARDRLLIFQACAR